MIRIQVDILRHGRKNFKDSICEIEIINVDTNDSTQDAKYHCILHDRNKGNDPITLKVKHNRRDGIYWLIGRCMLKILEHENILSVTGGNGNRDS